MKLGAEDKKKTMVLAVVGTVAVAVFGYTLYSNFATPDVPPPVAVTVTTPPSPVRPTTAIKHTNSSSSKKPVPTDAQLDPTLHMEAMLVTESLVYSGNGRNIFSPNSAPVGAISKPVAQVRTPTPIAPVRPVNYGPPPPPPIDLKFFGIATTANGGRQAFLLHGENVFVASAGDIVQRRYRIISIDVRSIVVEDIANSNKQTLPLLVN